MLFDSDLFEEVAYIEASNSVSFRQLFEDASGLSRLIEAEFKGCNFVGIQTKTSSKLLHLILAIWMSDKTPVLFHPRFPQEIVDALVESVGLKNAIIDESQIKKLFSKSTPSKRIRTTSFDDERLASVVFTSGSTGIPKAVAHSFGNHFSSALGAHENTPFQVGDRWAASLPMCHVGGLSLFFRSLIKGGTIIFLDKTRSFPDGIVATKATHLSLVPTQLLSLIDTKVSFLKKLKVLLIGGAAMPDFLFEECVERQIPIRLTYGMTETASQLATGLPYANNAGQALNYRKLKIQNSEIFVGGDVLFQGYIENGELIRRTEEWFSSGDLGRIDNEGNLQIEGRVDNMFISGGENIQPEQIEKVILGLGLFSEVYVVPVADKKFGFRPFVFVDELVFGNVSKELEVLHNKLAQKLPKFMWPVGLDVLPPKLGLKVSRDRLRKSISS